MPHRRKRSRREFERDNAATTNRFGMGETLSALRHESDVAKPVPDNSHTDESGAEWTTVSRKKKNSKNKPESASPTTDDKGNYPAITYSPAARVQREVKLGDLQALVLYLLADGTSPQWVSVQHHLQFKKVVVLMLPGLERDMFNGLIPLDQKSTPENEHETSSVNKDSIIDSVVASNAQQHHSSSPDDYYPTALVPENLPHALKPVADIFSHVWPVKAPGDSKISKLHSPIAGMLSTPLPKSEEFRKQKGVKPPREAKGWEDNPTPVTEFIATIDELRDSSYVIHDTLLADDEEKRLESERRQRERKALENGWVDSVVGALEEPQGSLTASKDGAADGWEVFAIDCEMCQTGTDVFELTRVTVVDWNGEVVMDELVKPDNPITDYLTRFSGITADMLKPVTTTLADIQKRLLEMLTPRTILLGHSLESDLNALKLTHPLVVDTSILYPHPRGPPLKSSLKWLSQKYLQRDIQKGSKGHDSAEDARAALDLVKLKCKRGPKWGTFDATTESIFKRLGRSPRAAESDEMRTSAIVDWGFPARGYGSAADICIGCENDYAVVEGVKRAVSGDPDGSEVLGGGVDFVWARMREVEALRGWWTGSKTADNEALLNSARAVTDASNQDPNGNDHGGTSEQAKLAEAVTRSVSRISEIYESLPPCTAFIVYSGTGNPRELSRLQGLHQTFKKEYAVKKWDQLSVRWTDVEEQALKAAYSKAKQGIAFVAVK